MKVVQKATMTLILVAGVVFCPIVQPLAASKSQEAKVHLVRMQIARKAKFSFAKSNNHCKTFVALIEFAVTKSTSKDELLTNLSHVVIGQSLDRTKGKRGIYYMGKSNASGFKSIIRDDSPQVEHAMAGLLLPNVSLPRISNYVGGVLKQMGLPVLSGQFVGLANEFKDAIQRGQPVSAEDLWLFRYTDDLGARLSNSNMKQFPKAVERVLCD